MLYKKKMAQIFSSYLFHNSLPPKYTKKRNQPVLIFFSSDGTICSLSHAVGRFFVYFGLVFWFMDDIINKKSSATGAFLENFIPLSCNGVVFAILTNKDSLQG